MPRFGERSGRRSPRDPPLRSRRRSIARASPTVTTEPGDQHGARPDDEPPDSPASASAVASSIASASLGATVTRSGAEDLARGRRELGSRKGTGVEFWVTTRCARCGSKAASTPSYSLSDITPITPIRGEKAKESSSASAVSRGAVRVVRGVEQDHRAAPDDLEPARRGRPAERVADQVGVERLVAEERLDRGQGRGGVLRLVRPVEREEDVVVLRVQTLQREQLAADRGHPGDDAELQALAHGVASTSAHRRSRTSAGPGSCSASTAVAPGLMIPAFSSAISSTEVAEVRRVVDADRGHHRDRPVRDVGGVPQAAHADLHDRDVDRRVRERGVRHPDDRLEEAQRVRLRGVDEVRVRRDVVEGADELRVGQRLAVDRDPLVDPLEVGAGEATRAQVERPQQGVDHPARGRLAVGAGQVDRPGRPAAGHRAAWRTPGCGRATARSGSPASATAARRRPR